MTKPEFRSVTFDTEQQWESGLLCRLKLDEGGLTLFSAPTFASFLDDGDPNSLLGIAADPCDRIYRMARQKEPESGSRRWCLTRHDPARGIVEDLICRPDSSHPSVGPAADRLLIASYTLWVLRGNRRVLAFSLPSLQLKTVVEAQEWLIDMALDAQGRLYLLQETVEDDKRSYRVCAHHPDGRPILSEDDSRPEPLCFGSKDLQVPVAIGIGDEGRIYLLDRSANGFLRFSPEGGSPQAVGDFSKVSPGGFKPSLMAIDGRGIIFAAQAYPPRLHQFDADGSHLGEVDLPPVSEERPAISHIRQIALGSPGCIYLLTDQGVARFDLQGRPVGEEGLYYSRTLDNGHHDGKWHRLALRARLPRGTGIDVHYQVSNEKRLKDGIDGILDSEDSMQAKKDGIEQQLDEWVHAHSLRSPRSGDGEGGSGDRQSADAAWQSMLFVSNYKGRYLWLKLGLSSFDDKQAPVLEKMRVYHPRLSFLRYLPATYQEDPVSADFLERFLSLFETVTFELDEKISALFRYFDPTAQVEDLDPQDRQQFLSWLGRWVNAAIEEEWPEGQKRELLRRAVELFKKKGTPQGLADFIELRTGKRATILETSLMSQPMVLNRSPQQSRHAFRLGVDSVVGPEPVHGFSLGEGAVLGRTALRSAAQRPQDPLLLQAHHFTVLLDMDSGDFQQAENELKRVLNDHKPAHTECSLRLVGGAGTGGESFVGFNTRLTDFQPFRLGVSSTLGQAVALIEGEPAGRLERNSVLGGNLTLI